MEFVTTAIAEIVFKKFLEKSGEKLAEAFAQQAGGALEKIASRHPDTAAALALGDPQVIDAEVIEVISQQAANDPELQAMLAEMAAQADREFDAEELAKLKAVQNASQAATAIAEVVTAKIAQRQVGIDNFEAGELEGEIEQKAKANPQATIEQVGATGVKVQGKAVIKVKQDIN